MHSLIQYLVPFTVEKFNHQPVKIRLLGNICLFLYNLLCCHGFNCIYYDKYLDLELIFLCRQDLA